MTHAQIGTAGISAFITCATPPYMPPTCNWVSITMTAQHHTSQLAPAMRGPGMRLKPSSIVSPVATV